ncbi:hypothetical protein AGMMS49959_15850 [Planctomycetales bacterium]|nr:hypothetical protein AGMMS49959_15720 [Planctomycetales bacterium]GHV23276.1 hypothetical protein AGMMS49959_15850 [Planctomycetales bacterium]
MLRVYLETTIFNRYFDAGREYQSETKLLFDKIAAGEIEAVTSTAVIDELEKATGPKRGQMLALIERHHIVVVSVGEAENELANVYLAAKIIPPKYRLDAVHIACAAVNNLDCIISLNFTHINKVKTKLMTEAINLMFDYANPIICTPMEVFDEND